MPRPWTLDGAEIAVGRAAEALEEENEGEGEDGDVGGARGVPVYVCMSDACMYARMYV